MPSCYRHGVKRPGDVILGVIAATATALLLALIALDAIRNARRHGPRRRALRGGLHLRGGLPRVMLKWLRT